MCMYGNSGMEVCEHKFTLPVDRGCTRALLNKFVIFTSTYLCRHVHIVVTVSLTSVSGRWRWSLTPGDVILKKP